MSDETLIRDIEVEIQRVMDGRNTRDTTDLLRRALAELKARDEDAERYRWWKSKRPTALITAIYGNLCMNKTIEDVDAHIDAARSKQHG